MPPLSRRDLLKAAAAAGVLPLLPACGESGIAGAEGGGIAPAPSPSPAPATPAPSPAPQALKVGFAHGVASGDPLSDAVILWTRLTPEQTGSATIAVQWRVARDPQLVNGVREGTATTSAQQDYTVKIDVTGLEAGGAYYYQFSVGEQRSPIGRTRTAPVGDVATMRLAFVTCSDYARGFYNAYRRVAERSDLQAVVHLGDYIYENALQDAVRPQIPAKETVTLDDYRLRYATVRSDADLQELHRQHPMIWVWDDHELCNNSWATGADAHDAATEGDFFVRRAAAFKAAHEWMPIRTPDARDLALIYRRFAFGTLIDLLMIDARQVGRDQPVPPNTVFADSVPVHMQMGAFTDASRQILGTTQEQWLLRELAASRSTWRVLGNQVYFSPLKLVGAPRATGASLFLSNDKWDGYEPARDRVLAAIAATDNVVVMTGDAHEAYAFEVTADPNNPVTYEPVTGTGSVAVEFVVTSTTTRGDAPIGDQVSAAAQMAMDDAEQALRVSNPHLKFYNNTLNGYMLLDFTPDRVQSEFWFVPMVGAKTDDESMEQAFTCASGSNHLVATTAVSAADPAAPPPAP